VDSSSVSLRLRQPTPEQAALAWAHLEAVIRGERPEPLVTRLYGFGYHFRHGNPKIDDWLAREIIGLWEVYRRGEVRQRRHSLEAQALRLGELAIVGLPGEPFACFGERLRRESPLPHLLSIEHANGFGGYLGPPVAYEHGGYEFCLAGQSRHDSTAGTTLTARCLKLLRKLA
jgi:hypothetical protein